MFIAHEINTIAILPINLPVSLVKGQMTYRTNSQVLFITKTNYVYIEHIKSNNQQKQSSSQITF